MRELEHLQEVFDLLRAGRHISPEDEPAFSALVANYDAFADYFAPLGLKLVRHPREFFYFEPDTSESMTQTLPRMAVFSFVLIDHAANAGKPIEEFLLGEHFFISKLPHFAFDRYAALLRQVDVEDISDLRLALKNMERLGWVKFLTEEEFRFLRPFHRVFDKCLELSRLAANANAANPKAEGEN
jgi:chromosome condensin MukBEF MukE localization factor